MRPTIPTGKTRETSIRRTAAGRWFHEGQPVDHPRVVAAFNRWVGRREGRYVLENDVNWAFVEIEGAPVFVERCRCRPEAIDLRLSLGASEPLDPETLRTDEDGRLYCDVRGGTLTALFTRQAMFDLEPNLVDDAARVAIRVGGRCHHPPRVADPVR